MNPNLRISFFGTAGMYKRGTIYTVLGMLLFMVACSSNTEDDLIENDPMDDEMPMLVTYQDVSSIFQNNCIVCHSNPPQNGAPMPLITYENVVEAIENRGLLDRISRNNGEEGLMPLGGPRLPQTTIDMVVQWEQDGLLEN